MKKILFLLILPVLVSCEEDTVSSPELIGTWNLIEILADPGDGSGTFQPIDSDKTLSFFSDSTVLSNAPLCNMFIEPVNVTGTGVYSLEDSTITPDCDNADFEMLLHFEIQREHLIVYYPCIEPCAEKYELSGQIQPAK